MFEHYVDFQKPQRPLWVRVAIGMSVAAHLIAAAALVVTAAWRINKLSIEEGGVAIASLGIPSSAPPPLAGKKIERKPLIKTKELAQPDDATANREISSSAGDAGEADGHEDGIAGSQGNTPGAPAGSLIGCKGIKCFGGVEPPAPRVAVVEQPKVVPQKALEALMLAGETQIRPSNTVKMKLDRAGKSSVHGIVQACIGTSGRITSVKLLRSTGYPSYDSKLLTGVRRWRYRAYQVNGKPIPVCTSISFIYRMNH